MDGGIVEGNRGTRELVEILADAVTTRRRDRRNVGNILLAPGREPALKLESGRAPAHVDEAGARRVHVGVLGPGPRRKEDVVGVGITRDVTVDRRTPALVLQDAAGLTPAPRCEIAHRHRPRTQAHTEGRPDRHERRVLFDVGRCDVDHSVHAGPLQAHWVHARMVVERNEADAHWGHRPDRTRAPGRRDTSDRIPRSNM